MDEEIKAQIIPIIENTKEGLAKAVDFLCEQSPILVKEILWWHGVQSALFCLLGLAILIILAMTRKKLWDWADEADGPSEGAAWMGVLVGQIMALIGGVGFVLTNFAWLKILIAPRLFLLEFMKDAIT